MSKMFAVWPEAGTSARVVVAAEPEITETFAYGDVVAPTATRYVEVDSEMVPFVEPPDAVQQPPVVAPEALIEPQEMLPDPSVCKAWEPAQEMIELIANVLACP